jgi:hypothetical protein
MATTTPNFGWPVPTSTDLVKDGATAIEGLGDAIDASLLDLKGGTTGQVLAKASGTDMDFTWVAQDDSNAIQNTIVDAKGDLIAASAADTPARLAVGTNGQVLTADSTTATGLAWATASSGMTNPMTTTGDTIYSSSGSTPARLGIGSTGQVLTVSGGVPTWATPAGGATFSGCSLRSSVDISVPDATSTTINFNTEIFDVDGYHDNSTNTNRITIPSGKTGYFLFVCQIRFSANSSGYRSINIRKNGATMTQPSVSNSIGNNTTVSSSFIVYGVPGDYYDLQAFQNSGSTLELGGSSNQIQNFAVTYLGA